MYFQEISTLIGNIMAVLVHFDAIQNGGDLQVHIFKNCFQNLTVHKQKSMQNVPTKEVTKSMPLFVKVSTTKSYQKRFMLILMFAVQQRFVRSFQCFLAKTYFDAS